MEGAVAQSGSRQLLPSGEGGVASHPRIRRVQLLTKVAHVEFHLVAGDAVRTAPDQLEQLVSRKHLARIPDERREELELQGRQRDVAAVERDGSLCEVDRQPRVGVGVLSVARLGGTTAKQRLDARN